MKNRGFKIATGTDEIDYVFSSIQPLEDTVIAAFTSIVPLSPEDYTGDDAGIVGITLSSGVTYPLEGTMITLTSGSAILYRL